MSSEPTNQTGPSPPLTYGSYLRLDELLRQQVPLTDNHDEAVHRAVEGARKAYDRVDEIPEVPRARPISLRAFDASDLMVDADVVDGRELQGVIERFFADTRVTYLHAHYAERGCYAAREDRA